MSHPDIRIELQQLRASLDSMGAGVGAVHHTIGGTREDMRSLRDIVDRALSVIPVVRPGQEKVWSNESKLVLGGCGNGLYKTGEMSTYGSDDAEFQLAVSSFDRSAQHQIFRKLVDVPVRITIERVPGGVE